MASKFYKKTLIAFGAFFALAYPVASQAVSIIPSDCLEGTAANCGFDDIIQLFVNLYSLSIVYVGAVALLFLIIGGFFLLTSAGRQDRVDLGKKIIANTIVGIVVVMTAFLIVNLIQTQVLQVDDQYLITSGSDCSDKENGSVCSLLTGAGNSSAYQSVYACVDGICAMSLCEYGWRYKQPYESSGYWRQLAGGIGDHKSCMSIDECEPGTIYKNQCPGGSDNVCCFASNSN